MTQKLGRAYGSREAIGSSASIISGPLQQDPGDRGALLLKDDADTAARGGRPPARAHGDWRVPQ